LRVVALGAVGYAVESSFFYAGLQHGTAAAVALLFYVYPAIVTVIEIASGAVAASRRLLGALGLSVAGTALIVVTGSAIAIAPIGVVFAITSAFCFSVYLLVSSRVVKQTDALVSGAWVASGAALSLTTQGLVVGGLRSPGASWWLMLANGLATAAAFSLLFAALKHLGASRTAVVMTLEALSGVVLGALVLGEPISAMQLVGGASILGATVLISTTKSVPEVLLDEL
jgi:drug/metabolite transporter (DMT)-like permease